MNHPGGGFLHFRKFLLDLFYVQKMCRNEEGSSLYLQWKIHVREPAATCACSDLEDTRAPALKAPASSLAAALNVTQVINSVIDQFVASKTEKLSVYLFFFSHFIWTYAECDEAEIKELRNEWLVF